MIAINPSCATTRTRLNRVALAIFLLPLFVGVNAVGMQPSETLAEALAPYSLPGQSAVPRLNSPITSYATLDDPSEFVIAYYLATPDNLLRFPLFISRLDKSDGTWTHAALDQPKVFGALPSTPSIGTDCMGSVLEIRENAGRYFLDLHWNPSAGCLLILNRDFTVHHALPGGVVAFLRGGVIWERNTVHFAPTHPEQLWLYDPQTRRSQRLYPQPKDQLRKAFSKRLAEVVDPEQCRRNDWRATRPSSQVTWEAS